MPKKKEFITSYMREATGHDAVEHQQMDRDAFVDHDAALKIEMRSVSELTPYAKNPRNNEPAVDAVAASIREFGFKVPIILDKDGVIVAGHTRLKAAKKLGMEQVPCLIADDLRPEQIEANFKNYEELQGMRDFTGADLMRPDWIVGDSRSIDTLTDKSGFDFAITCPPYGDLEQYSDNPADISNMDYSDFLEAYREIIHKTVDKLKDNAFFAIVVGDIRDKQGYYRDFIGDTKQAAFDAGCKLYNDCVLVEVGATAGLRVAGQFDRGRKVVKIHQNVIVFLKGDAKTINLEPYNFNLETPEEL